jgi:hypothetical protein
MGYRAAIITPDGQLEVRAIEDGEIVKVIGCDDLQGIAFQGRRMVYVDGEGLLKGLPINAVASRAMVDWLEEEGRVLLGQVLRGTVVVCQVDEGG